MARAKVDITTTYDGKGAKQAKSDLGDVGKKGKAETARLKDAFGRLDTTISGEFTKLASGLGLALGAKEILDLGVETFQAAEKARVATSAFTNLSGSANIAKINLQAMSRATRGLISDTEQMQIANQLLGMSIVQTDQQLEQVVGVSRRLGKEFKGLGAREAAEEFAIMIANMSAARLDSFGLSSGRVRGRINELMATTEDMTREQAFFQATMEEGEKTLQRLGPELNTTSDEVARLGAVFSNLQVALGKTAEESGIISNLFKTMADDLVRFQALFDDTPETQIAALSIELSNAEERLRNLKETEQQTGFFGVLAAVQIPAAEKAIISFRQELEGLTVEQEKQAAIGRAEQDRLQAAIASEEKVAENIAKRAEAAKKLAEVQKEFSRDVIDLQEQTSDELLDSQEKFDDDREKAEAASIKRITSLRKSATDDRLNAAKRLQKNLGEIDIELGKSLAKQRVDKDKAIDKAQKAQANDEKINRQRKRIDAAGDERLFQFELRRLAADGNAIAIQEALERRQIEQEIASEKAEFEKKTERDKKDDQIQTMRDEGTERRAQLQQQARERSDDLKAGNIEENLAKDQRLIEEELQEGEAFKKRNANLETFFDKRNTEIREGEQEGLSEIAEALTQAEDLTSTQLDSMVNLAKEFGPKFGEAFADGMTKAISENLKIGAAIGAASDIGAGAGPLPIAAGGETRPGRGGIPVFQEGGFVERSGIAFVDRGERVIPAGQAGGIIININAPVFGVDDLEAKLNVWGQEIIDSVAGAMN